LLKAHPMDFEGFGNTYAAELKYQILGTEATVVYTIETSTFSNDSACKVTPPSAGKCALRTHLA
jgi:hypothetical protein